SLSDFFIGGRRLNSWVAALSAHASDMSGWLFLGLIGMFYTAGFGAIWLSLGLAVGTILNWLLVAKRLRRYTITSKYSITMPEYFENRFRDSSHALRLISSIFIIFFFTIYTASSFVACGTLFSLVFSIDYQIALLIGALVILAYTFLGGFRAVCWTDFIQGLLMMAVILTVPLVTLYIIGGFPEIARNVPPELFNFTDARQPGGAVSIVSELSWGLGYFGMPHILVRFMATKREKDLSRAALIAGICVLLSMALAFLMGMVSIVFDPAINTPETAFIIIIEEIFMRSDALIPIPLLGSLCVCGILAAIMSTADSQLLVTASSITSDIYQGVIKKKRSNKHLLNSSRLFVIIVSIIAYLIAVNPSSNIIGLVSNAWAGFGATFGALTLLSLYWRRLNRNGALAGIISGALTVIVWDFIPLIKTGETWTNLGQITGLYSLAPGFGISLFCIVAVSLITKEPVKEIYDEFEVAAAKPILEE
ncbi:MAG: sodium/proline symporter, partial [Treponema sp.]|nr:sodium/proline symporter [Treponema sp.]